MADSDTYSIGVDIGGTFTDLVVADGAGAVHTAKAFTTPDDYSRGVLDAIDAICAGPLAMDPGDLLGRTRTFVNGTTIVTNALAELNGVRVGLLTTEGFRDTLRIARSARTNEFDLQTQIPPPELVARGDIAELRERVDHAGKVVVPLDEAHMVEQVRWLVEERGVEAVAVCLLWSFRNPDHERRVRDHLAEAHPDLFVTISSDIYPVSREYERTVTTVLNCYTSRGAEHYLGSLERQLRERGLTVPVGVLQSTGGVTSTDDARTRPIHLLNSGPVGGVVAANRLGQLLGIGNLITADMGGTSFDTAVIVDNEIGYLHRARVNRLDTGLSVVDINAVGAGGGSICSVDDQGLPRVGPRSAGASPGPACYARGGEEACVTDVAAVMDLIDPAYFLGGTVTLDRDRAVAAVDAHVAGPLGVDADTAAAGLYDLVVANMANAVRAVSVERGHDPRDFTMVAYGGAASLFIAAIAADLGVERVLIPDRASVFSAQGLLLSDYSHRAVRTVNWNLAKGDPEELNRVYAELEAEVLGTFERDGFDAKEVRVSREGDFKFGTQVYEITIPVTGERLTAEDKPAMAERFISTYEGLYGEGASWVDAESLIVLLTIRVTGVVTTAQPAFEQRAAGAGSSADARTGERQLHGREVRSVPVYREDRLAPGMTLDGEAIVEAKDTTIYVPPEWHAAMDGYRNLTLTHGGRA